MAADREKEAPSLEPPSLFRRKKKAAPAPPSDPVLVPVPVPVPDEADDSPTTIFDDTSEPTPDLEPDLAPDPAPELAATQVQAPAASSAASSAAPSVAASPLTPPPAPAAAEEPRPPREPWLTGRPAAVLTGLLVGALIVAATAASLRLCTAVKGTSSCGGPGFFLLVAILIVAVMVGAGLLRAAHVPEPGSTSFLAVGLLSVIALLFLVGTIFEWWMAIVIPLVSVATFLLSHWVTTTFIDPADDGSDPDAEPEPHDVR